MAIRNVNNIDIENATLKYLSFAGKEGRYNRPGDRNFCVIIDDPKTAQALSDEGWNIRILKPTSEDEEVRYYIQVTVNFNFWRKPEIYLISQSGRKTLLDEESVATLDYADIISCDLSIRPRVWDDNGTTKIKAYLQEMYVRIRQSKFAEKYASEEAPVEPAYAHM